MSPALSRHLMFVEQIQKKAKCFRPSYRFWYAVVGRLDKRMALVATAIARLLPAIVVAERFPPGMPRPPDGRGAFTAVTLRDGKILILGGVIDGQTMQINPVAPTETYDPKTREFSRVADMAVPVVVPPRSCWTTDGL